MGIRGVQHPDPPCSLNGSQNHQSWYSSEPLLRDCSERHCFAEILLPNGVVSVNGGSGREAISTWLCALEILLLIFQHLYGTTARGYTSAWDTSVINMLMIPSCTS